MQNLASPQQLLGLLTASCLALACSGQDDTAAAGATSAAASTAAAEGEGLSATEAKQRGLVSAQFPDDGVRIEHEGEFVTLFARHAARFGVLRKLAVRYRFEVVDWSDDDPLVDVFVENAALETALARLIEPTPYTVAYSHEAESDQNQITRIVIGDAPEPDAETRSGGKRERGEEDAEEQARRDHERRERRYKPRSAEDAARRMAEREIRQEERKARALEDLQSDDPTAREDAVAGWLDAEDPAENALLTDLALHDPEPAVRAEAARQLSFGAATTRLSGAFFDPNPTVAIAALEAGAWSPPNPELYEAMQAAAQSANPDIANAALDAITDYEMANDL